MKLRYPTLAALPLFLLAVAAFAQPDFDPMNFGGSLRAGPKTSMLPGPGKDIKSVQESVNTAVKPLDDKAVLQQFPAVKNANGNRVAPEKHVVTVHAKLFAVRLEDDKDFHCILGDGGQEVMNR